jgi:hypothetical protein
MDPPLEGLMTAEESVFFGRWREESRVEQDLAEGRRSTWETVT